MARRAGLPFAERQVFLDHERGPGAIEKAWQSLLERATQDGQALAIGHPHPETIAFLGAAIARVEAHDARLVTVSELLTVAESAPGTVSTGVGAQNPP
jgi:polysaccharide deacetylase 2 family uncharacterized protein YibQ